MKLIIATLILLNAVVFYLYHNGLLVTLQGGGQEQMLPVVKPEAQLRLLDDLRQPALDRDEESAAVVASASCYTLEALTEDEQARLSEALQQQQIDVQSQAYKIDEISNYWVYVPALATRAEARALHRRIRDLGVKDVYVIEAGRNKNSVSLGLYGEKAAADERVIWFNSKDVAAVLAARHKTTNAYRLEIASPAPTQDENIEHIINERLGLKEYQKKSCK